LSIKNSKFVSVLLAGGLSKRFGETKTLAKINGQTIFEKIIKILKKQKIEILINANCNEEIFLKSNLTIIKDLNHDLPGPLGGLLAAMNWVKLNNNNIEWILSVPSDTPFLPVDLLKIFKANIKKKIDILIARSNDKIHPVIGLWNIRLFDSLKKELELENRKIMKWVFKNNYDFVDFPIQKFDPFFNINKKKDIIEAEKIEKNLN